MYHAKVFLIIIIIMDHLFDAECVSKKAKRSRDSHYESKLSKQLRWHSHSLQQEGGGHPQRD